MLQYKLTEKAKSLSMLDFTPKRKTVGSAGYDLCACIEEELWIQPGAYPVKVGTGVHVWLGADGNYNEGNATLCAFLLPRSSIKGLQLSNTVGLMDEDYQGEYIASLYNYTGDRIKLVPGQCIVQFVITLAYTPELLQVEEFKALTERGEGGFGHTDGKQQ
jgi:dUTP pyrophosphatase